ncbi:uncharacterized protein B0I36DRAFT_132719 [Microdochium trichocladiopsis]|uniref:Uncharacterized protein n=1 Tax=Microdochium trichocladiopsis TaxID=1682393 RepID=A0A9P8Y7E9_9PEZI|nr:uncharacterized protein B0I36DRAFT_132719 [Microdochium trichocladiopsis]KAH7029437.1 hypothetical protein B0I36DRAFT_132719 [Microdochium trichocladiopsis]
MVSAANESLRGCRLSWGCCLTQAPSRLDTLLHSLSKTLSKGDSTLLRDFMTAMMRIGHDRAADRRKQCQEDTGLGMRLCHGELPARVLCGTVPSRAWAGGVCGVLRVRVEIREASSRSSQRELLSTETLPSACGADPGNGDLAFTRVRFGCRHSLVFQLVGSGWYLVLVDIFAWAGRAELTSREDLDSRLAPTCFQRVDLGGEESDGFFTVAKTARCSRGAFGPRFDPPKWHPAPPHPPT